MKPIKLIISAFGPYADQMPEIRFDTFDERGLFLISGDTGAGKTTIFDAIIYALYGDTSGSFRGTKNLRSEYAKESTKSFVDFYFSHQGKNYHIYRAPSFERVNRNGRLVEEAEKVIFYDSDGTSVEGTKNVDGTKTEAGVVRELLHIDKEQFKQIAMIAQGEFWDLLNARTEQRTAILRTIFMTGAYKNIEFRLKERMDRKKKEKERAEQSIVQYFRDVRADEDDVLYAELAGLQEKAKETGSVWNLQEMLDLLERLIASDREKLEETEKNREEADSKLKETENKLATAEINNGFLDARDRLEKERQELESRKPEIERQEALLKKQKKASREVYPFYREWKTKRDEAERTEKEIAGKTEELGTADENLRKAEEQRRLAEEQQPEIQQLNVKAEKIRNEEQKYKERDGQKKEEVILSNRRDELETRRKALALREEELQKQINSLQELSEKLKDKPAELVQMQAKNRAVEELAKQISGILDAQKGERAKRKKILEDKQGVFRRVFGEYERANTERIKAEKILDGCRAGILAKYLTEGAPCPVCGSMHHPDPASLPEVAVTEEEFEEYKRTEQRASDEKEKASAAAAAAKSALEEYEKQMLRGIRNCLESPVLEPSAEASVQTCVEPASNGAFDGAGNSGEMEEKSLDVWLEELVHAREITAEKKRENDALIKNLQQECSQKEEADQQLQEARGKKTEEIEEQKRKLSEAYSRNEASLAACRATLASLKDLDYDSWQTASAEMEQIDLRFQELQSNLEAARTEEQKAGQNREALRAAKETLENNLKAQRDEENLKRQKLLKKLAEHSFADEEEMLRCVVTEEEMRAADKKVQDYRQAVSTNAVQLDEARVNAEGKLRIDVEELNGLRTTQKDALEDIRNRENAVRNRVKNNIEKQTHMLENSSGLENSTKEFNLCSRLYKLVSGQTGNGKITLEQYIQAAGFDGIIAAANRRLLPMSDGQYQLFRQEDSLGKKSNTFLDLEVLDNYTGHRRPVGNLSGGESFKASLSLALGLSDTVSANLGGVQMDALFIDEGFGTLDRKSIENAMDILLNLSGANKLVGVISHREELIENIPQQIRVRKTREGSVIEIDRGV
jgi:exonuclease SbcC